MKVDVRSWSPSEALARVDGVRVRVRRYKAAVVWICQDHGRQRNAPSCEHTRALAETPVPATKFVDGPPYGDRRVTTTSH